MQKSVEIIPTMTVYNSFEKYVEVMRMFFEENVKTIRVNMTRFELTRYITEIL